MLNKILLSLIILCLIIPLTHAAVPNISDLSTWITIGLTIVIIHILLVSLAYMYANFFMAEDLKGWSKNEIMQAVFSIIILVSFVGVFTFVNTLSESYFAQIIDASNVGASEETLKSFCFNEGTNRWSSSETCTGLKVVSDGKGTVSCEGTGSDNCNPMFLMARSYLGISFERLASVHQMLLRNYALMSAMNSMGFNVGVYTTKEVMDKTFGGSISMNFMKDGVYLSVIESLILFVEKLLLALKFQESVLKFMEYGLAFYLIILGLIFRSIFIFRKFGGLLLSLGICFMFVLPLLYILGWYTLSIPNIEVAMDENFKGGEVSIADNWIFWTSINSMMILMGLRVVEFFSLDRVISAGIKTGVDTLILVGQTVMFVQYGTYVNANSPDFYFTNYDLDSSGNTYENAPIDKIGILDYISRFMIIALAVPLLNIYIFFAFVRGLSPLLGGDAEIPALGRFL